MSWHVASYTGFLAGTANTDTPADPSDSVLTILNSHYVLRQSMMLIGALGIGALLTRQRLDSPTMRFYGNPFVRPVVNAAVPPSNSNFDFRGGRPFALPVGEEIAVQSSNSGAGPTQTSAFLSLQDVKQPLPAGNVYTVRFTSSTAAVANQWSNLTYTLDTALPSGGYALVGSELIATNAVYHRWFIYPQIWRPGFPCFASEAGRLDNEFYRFPFGEMGRFINTALPILQVWDGATDASYVGYMYLIPVAPGSIVMGPAGQPIITTSGPGGMATIGTY